MLLVLAHFGVGATLSLAISLFVQYRDGGSFSLSFAFIVIGIVCAVLAHFLSPWCTPLVVLLFLLASLHELHQDQAARVAQRQPDNPPPPQN